MTLCTRLNFYHATRTTCSSVSGRLRFRRGRLPCSPKTSASSRLHLPRPLLPLPRRRVYLCQRSPLLVSCASLSRRRKLYHRRRRISASRPTISGRASSSRPSARRKISSPTSGRKIQTSSSPGTPSVTWRSSRRPSRGRRRWQVSMVMLMAGRRPSSSSARGWMTRSLQLRCRNPSGPRFPRRTFFLSGCTSRSRKVDGRSAGVAYLEIGNGMLKHTIRPLPASQLSASFCRWQRASGGQLISGTSPTPT
mmetsp:Transcript_15514/g.38430  ORF Transcript_15514/g.38430 Transcript_15514/m.38430 type:complete len:251 (-) Transcript_15514:3659-4411(-)